MDDADPVTVDDAVKAKKPRSSTAFPYYSLDKSIEVAKVVHERAGGQCARGQLAGLLDYSGVKNGGFLTRISAAKMFGLIEESGDTITLTDRAKKILSPVRQSDGDQAKLDAFMAVELFRRVFNDFDGHTLPAPAGLTNLFLTTYKIVPNQVASALRNLMDSATTAGLFNVAGRTRLIKPIIQSDGMAPPPPPKAEDRKGIGSEGDESETRNGSANGNGAGSGSAKPVNAELAGVHPALIGLIQNLPAIGATLGPKRRAALIDAFKHTINFVYPEEED